MTVSEDTTIYTVSLDRGPNVVNPELIDALEKAITIVERASHPKALVLIGRDKKFFSNGLDLKFMQTHNPKQVAAMIEHFWRFLAKLLVMDCRTVAAINGHAFGAGLFLALACDFRIMRTKRGYLNWPELNLGMRLGKGFAELTKAKVTDPQVLRQGVLCGTRYTSRDALQAQFIDQECAIEDLERQAHALATMGLPQNLKAKFFHPTSFQQMKQELYTDAYRTLSMATMNSLPSSRL